MSSTVLARRILAAWFVQEAEPTADAIAAFNRKLIANGLVTLDPSTFALDTYARTVIADAVMTAASANLASAAAPFVAGDVGKKVYVQGAGVAGATLTARILTFTNSGAVVLDTSASTSVDGSADAATVGIAVVGLTKDQPSSDGSYSQLPAPAGASLDGFTNADDTALGVGAGATLTPASRTTLVGAGAGASMVGAGDSVAVGYAALGSQVNGDGNTGVGSFALAGLNGGSAAGNTAVGRSAGVNMGDASNNLAAGYAAGDEIVHGIDNVLLGYKAGKGLGDLSNTAVIGSSDAPIDSVIIPSNHAYGPDFLSRVRFRDNVILPFGAAPNPAHLYAGSLMFYADEASNKVLVVVKYADGATVKVGEIPVV